MNGEIGVYYFPVTLMGPLQESFSPGPLIMNILGGEEGTKARASYLVGGRGPWALPTDKPSPKPPTKLTQIPHHRLFFFSGKGIIVWAVAIRKTSESS